MKKRIFISYSHKDESFKNELLNHLSVLKRMKIISEWHDRRITPGEEFDKRITQELRDSEIILLLISSDFIASDYIYNIELKHALEMHNKKEAVVIPVILRSCSWEILELGKLLALPKDGKAISSWDSKDDAYKSIVDGITSSMKKLEKENPKSNLKREEGSIFVPKNSILIKLPRGYIILSDLEYSNVSHWAVTAWYQFYDQNFGGGTHYHKSYRKNWEQLEYREIQFRKLQIPISDQNYAERILNLIMDLRDRNEEVSIKEILKRYEYMETPCQFFEGEQELDIRDVSVPKKFSWLNKTGEIRDLSEEYKRFSFQNYEISELKESLNSKRRYTYLLVHQMLPESNPGIDFLKEVVNEFDKKMNYKELELWSKSMHSVLQDIIYFIRE